MQPPPGHADVRFNPYAPPAAPPVITAAVAAPGALPGAQVRLFTPGQVALASFLGSILGGAVLMALNERRLGKPRAAWLTLGLAMLASALLIGLAMALPSGTGGATIGILPVIAMRQIAVARQPVVLAHVAAGGKKGSWGAAVGIALGCLVLLCLVGGIVGMVTGAGGE